MTLDVFQRKKAFDAHRHLPAISKTRWMDAAIGHPHEFGGDRAAFEAHGRFQRGGECFAVIKDDRQREHEGRSAFSQHLEELRRQLAPSRLLRSASTSKISVFGLYRCRRRIWARMSILFPSPVRQFDLAKQVFDPLANGTRHPEVRPLDRCDKSRWIEFIVERQKRPA
jgi:hypothetical protein